jgi:hypothetical protein
MESYRQLAGMTLVDLDASSWGTLQIVYMTLNTINDVLCLGKSFVAMCMFDKFHVTCNPKSKVSRDVFKNKIECQLTSTFYSKNVTSIFGLHNILEI